MVLAGHPRTKKPHTYSHKTPAPVTKVRCDTARVTVYYAATFGHDLRFRKRFLDENYIQ